MEIRQLPELAISAGSPVRQFGKVLFSQKQMVLEKTIPGEFFFGPFEMLLKNQAVKVPNSPIQKCPELANPEGSLYHRSRKTKSLFFATSKVSQTHLPGSVSKMLIPVEPIPIGLDFVKPEGSYFVNQERSLFGQFGGAPKK